MLLDIDDTLVDTRGAFRHALASVADSYLAPGWDADEITAFWRADAQGWYRAHARGEMTHRQQRMLRANALHAAFGGPPLDDVSYDAWDAAFERAFREGWRPHADAAALLDALEAAGIPYGAVSNADSAYQAGKLSAVGLQRVPLLVGVDTFGVGKPDPRVFLAGCERLGVAPAEAAYVGDEPDIDAQAAVDAGLALGVWVDRESWPPGRGEHWTDGPRLVRVAGLERVPELLAPLPA